MFICAACNQFTDQYEYRVYRLASEIEAGADFIQAQRIFNMDNRDFIKKTRPKGVA